MFTLIMLVSIGQATISVIPLGDGVLEAGKVYNLLNGETYTAPTGQYYYQVSVQGIRPMLIKDINGNRTWTSYNLGADIYIVPQYPLNNLGLTDVISVNGNNYRVNFIYPSGEIIGAKL